MKWLYRILRLFFCPHKYKAVEKFDCYDRGYNDTPTRVVIRQECCYCGKPNVYEVQ